MSVAEIGVVLHVGGVVRQALVIGERVVGGVVAAVERAAAVRAVGGAGRGTLAMRDGLRHRVVALRVERPAHAGILEQVRNRRVRVLNRGRDEAARRPDCLRRVLVVDEHELGAGEVHVVRRALARDGLEVAIGQGALPGERPVRLHRGVGVGEVLRRPADARRHVSIHLAAVDLRELARLLVIGVSPCVEGVVQRRRCRRRARVDRWPGLAAGRPLRASGVRSRRTRTPAAKVGVEGVVLLDEDDQVGDLRPLRRVGAVAVGRARLDSPVGSLRPRRLRRGPGATAGGHEAERHYQPDGKRHRCVLHVTGRASRRRRPSLRTPRRRRGARRRPTRADRRAPAWRSPSARRGTALR